MSSIPRCQRCCVYIHVAMEHDRRQCDYYRTSQPMIMIRRMLDTHQSWFSA